MQHRAKKILWVFLFAAISFPAIQSCLSLFTPGPLFGYFVKAENVSFSTDKWWDGSYQEQKTKYYNDNMGFREDLVRLNNQLDISLFYKIHADAILGKNRFLFQPNYISEHWGQR